MHVDAVEKAPKLAPEELQLLQAYGTFHNRVVDFQRKATIMTFDEVFGKEEASRLFMHFRFDCQEYFAKFLTYLTQEQRNNLYVHVLRCPRYR